MPYWDQWDLVPALRAAAEHRFEVAWLWAPHNEHRIVLPKALMLALAGLTRWDVRAEMLASLGAALVTLGLLRSLLSRTMGAVAPGAVPHLTLLASLGGFALTGWERWLWGWNICVHLGALAAVGAAWAMARWGDRWRGALVALLAGTAGALSFGSGLAMLAVVPVAVWATARGSRRQRLVRFALTAAVGAGVILAITAGLPMPGPWPALASAPAHGLYVLVYLGSIFRALGVAGSGVAGGLGVLAFVLAGAWLWSRRPAARPASCPWLLLGGSVVLGAGMTAIARTGLFGPGQALSPRYTALSSLFWLSVAAVTVLAVAPVTRRPPIARVPRGVLLAGWVAVAAVVAGTSVAHALSEIRYQHGRLQEATRCLRSDAVPSKACLRLIYPDQGPAIHERLAWLRDARLSLFAPP